MEEMSTSTGTLSFAAVALGGAILASSLTDGVASAAPEANQAARQLTFAIPAIGGVEIGPGGVPGGSFQQTRVTARPQGEASVVFVATGLAPWFYQYAYRYVSVAWHNLSTGATGTVALRHWRRPSFPVTGNAATLPTAATARTGAGAVVATVTVMREQYKGSAPSSIIPGLNALIVP
jgi:hypothetical protein